MFSGIIEHNQSMLQSVEKNDCVQVWIERPKDFDDLKVGDSVACNGVCLTVEAIDEDKIQFTLGPETLKVLQGSLAQWKVYPINLERSLKMSDRIHGHLVTGHVDGLGQIQDVLKKGDALDLKIKVPKEISNMIFKKGSLTVHGVSLTVNEVADVQVSVGLIPETIKRTNLKNLKIGDWVNLEVDPMARAIHHMIKEFYEVRQN